MVISNTAYSVKKLKYGVKKRQKKLGGWKNYSEAYGEDIE